MLRSCVARVVVTCIVACLVSLATFADDARLPLRTSSGPRADIAALILGGQESGSLRVTGLAVATCAPPTAPGAGQTQVPVDLVIEVEGRSLLDAVSSVSAADIPRSVRVEIYTYVMNRSGEIAASSSKWARAPLVQLSRPPLGGIKLVDRLDLPPGEYQARVLVREPSSQQFSVRVLEVSIPSREDSKPALSVPIFRSEDSSWLVAADIRIPEDQLPSALPVVSPARRRVFRLDGCGLADADIEGRLLSMDGEAIGEAEIRIGTPRSIDGVQTVDGELEMPTLESGLYILEVDARHQGHRMARRLPVFVSNDESIASWTGVGSLEPEPELEDDTAGIGQPSGTRKRIAAIERGYLGVLEVLAGGRLDESIDALVRLEKEAIDAHENRRKSLKWLTEGENRVTRRLHEVEPQSLLPLLMLHLETQARYAAMDEIESDLVEASRTRVRALAEVYASDAGQEMAAPLAAAALTELAVDLQGSGHLISALLVLRDALALDPSNTDVLLELAYQYEHHGFREEALELLRHLLDVEPRSDEGRLRLGVTLLRSDHQSEGLQILQAVIGDGTTGWAVAVAYQELGKHLLRSERFDDAAKLLAPAVERFPANQRLRIELAYALDRTGERPRSRAIATSLPPDRESSSPRLLYRVPERRDTLRSRRALVRHVTARIPLLASALTTVRGTG